MQQDLPNAGETGEMMQENLDNQVKYDKTY